MIFNGALLFSALASHGTRFVGMVFKHENFYRYQDYVEMVIFDSSIPLSNDHVLRADQAITISAMSQQAISVGRADSG